MQYYWINKKGNKKLTVFFNGWGMDEKSVQHMDSADFDIVVFFDYRNTDTDENIFDEINKYKEVYVAGWSMGVMMSTLFENKINDIISKIAIAGTPVPIDDKFGIPTKIYNLTANNFNDLSKKKFLRNMFAVDNSKFINRTTEELKEELIAQKSYKAIETSFTKAIIPTSDKVIPTQNQFNYWEKKPDTKIQTVECGHYPFFAIRNWSEIING